MAVTDIDATASEEALKGAKGSFALLPIGVAVLPCSEFRVMDALRRAIALAEVEAFMIDDVVPDLIRYFFGIQNGGDAHYAEHGSAETDATHVVPPRPGEPGVLDVPRLKEPGVEQPVNRIGDEGVLPYIGPEEVPAPSDEDGAPGNDIVLRCNESDEGFGLLPLEPLGPADYHLSEISQYIIRSPLKVVGDPDASRAGADGP